MGKSLSGFREYVLEENIMHGLLWFGKSLGVGVAGVISGLLQAAASVAENIVASIVLGPETQRYFDKKSLSQCVGMIMRNLARVGANSVSAGEDARAAQERTQTLESLIQHCKHAVDQFKRQHPGEEKAGYGHMGGLAGEIGHRVVEPIPRALAGALKGLFVAGRNFANAADPHGQKQVQFEQEDYCYQNFSKLIVHMDDKTRESFYQQLRAGLERINNPNFVYRFLRGMGRFVYNNT